MNAHEKKEHERELETNSLAQGLNTVVEKAKAGTLVSPRVLGVTLAVVLVGGLWYYLASESRRAVSAQWASLALTPPVDLEKYANENKDSLPGTLARLEAARSLLGPEGIGQLSARDKESGRQRELRNKAVVNIEKARDEFATLADNFQGDPTLRAESLTNAAEAELALLGVPPAGKPNDSRGSVERAAEFLTQAAKAVGEATPAGTALAKRAADLTANKLALLDAAITIYRQANPEAFEVTLPPAAGGPAPPSEAPKLPTGPILPPTPPAGAGSPATKK